MAASGFTPIQLYRTTTALAVPTAGNLADGELAINLTDEKLYFKNAAGVVKLLSAASGASGTVTSVDVSGGTTGLSFSGGPITTSGTITMAGTLAVANGGTGVTSSTGTGSVVLSNSPTLVTPALGAATATSLTLSKLALTVDSPFYTGGNISSGANSLGIGTTGATVFGVFTNNLERMRVTAAGNVGVGTTAPAVRFVVSNDGTNGFEFNTTDNIFQTYNRSTSAYTDMLLYALQHRFFAGSTPSEAMRIASGGNVGIGTTSPSSKLDVNGTGYFSDNVSIVRTNTAGSLSGLTINNSGTTAAYAGVNVTSGSVTSQFFNDAAGNAVVAGAVLRTTTNHPFVFGTNNTERMRITAAGDVGIGTITPGAKLEVIGGLDAIYNANVLISSSASSAKLAFNPNGVSSAGVGSASGGLIFYASGANTERMRIASNGNVTVGDTASYGRLASVAADGTYQLALVGTSKGLRLRSDTNDFKVEAVDQTLVTTYQPLWLGGSIIQFGTGTTERVRIDASGNVGIGTVSPGARLDVNGTTRSGNFRVNAGGTVAGAGMWGIDTVLAFNTDSLERMRIDASGNVSIGTSAANNRFLVTYANPVSVPAAGAGGHCTAFGTVGYGLATGALTNGNSYLQVTRWDATATNYDLLLQPNGGNVLIGTGTSGYKLEVAAGGSNIRAYTASGNAEIMAQSAAGGAAILDLQTAAGLNRIAGGVGGTSNLSFYTASTERMRITSAGNVGIGSSSPTEKLVVATNTASSGLEIGVGVTNTVDSNIFIRVSGSANTDKKAVIGPDTSTAFVFNTAGTERMRITSAGIAGVGTTIPASYATRLAVVGGNLGVSEDGATVTTIRANANVSNIGAFNATGASLAFGTAPSGSGEVERMRIDSAGNVGIATAAPIGRFAVQASQQVGFNGAVSGSPQAGNLFYGTDNTGWKFDIGKLVSGTFTAQMTIQDNGNIGIGTTSPGSKLEVSNAASACQIRIRGGTAGSSAPELQFYGNSSDHNWTIQGNHSTALQFFKGTFGALGPELMRLDINGNLGIGTTTTGYNRLNIGNDGNGSATVGLSFTTSATERAFINLNAASGEMRFSAGYPVYGGFSTFYTVGSERMRITGGGDVGIGTSSPGGKLEVYQTAASPTIRMFTNFVGGNAVDLSPFIVGVSNAGYSISIAGTIRQVITGAGDVGIGTTSPQRRLGIGGTANAYMNFNPTSHRQFTVGSDANGFIVFDDAAAFYRMVIDAAGNVGFNVNAPSYPMEVRADAASAARYIGITNTTATGSTGAAGYLARAGSNFAYFYVRGDGVAYIDNATANPLGFATNGSERARIDASGNLLLGTASAGSPGFATTNSFNISFAEGADQSFATIFRQANSADLVLGSGVRRSGTANGFASSTASAWARSSVNVGYGTIKFFTAAEATVAVGTDVTLNERMRIDINGNVCIGTTSAAGRLNVAGTTAITWAAGGTSLGLVTIGDQGTSGGSLFVNTPSLNTSFASGFGVDGSYTNPGGVGTSVINIKAFGVNSGGGYGSDLAFHTAVGATLSEKFRITSTGAITSSNLADAVGYKGVPQNSRTANYTLALSDIGKHISITTGNVVIPANASVAFPIGSAITIYNDNTTTQTVSITSDTLRQAGTTNTGTRTIASYGLATLLKVSATVWVITGNLT